MSARLISLVSRLLSLLPLSLNQAIGQGVATLVWLSRGRARRITEFNLQHCYPDMDSKQRQALAFSSLKHTGMQLAECAWIWHRPHEQTQAHIVETHGEQCFLDAIASERGAILISPHMGNWELSNLPLSNAAPLTYFYRSPRNKALGPLLLKWRAHLGGKPAKLDAGGIREALKVLKSGGVLGLLPDQEPDKTNGVFAPFFNQPALTMTLLNRLATRSKAQVILMVMERLPKAQGWRVHYLPANPRIVDEDQYTAAEALNQDVERCISIAPEQYIWSYKRFNTCPDGTRRKYR